MITREEIEVEFEAQLARINDPSIKEKVINTWVNACRKGGWETMEALKELPFTIVTHANGIGLLQHIKAATEGAVALAGIQKEHIPTFPHVDIDILVAGALLHDINKVMAFARDEEGKYIKKAGISGENTAFPGVEVVRDSGLPDSIAGLVEYECKNGKIKPCNIETIFVHHADFITFDSMFYLNNS